MKKRSGGFAPYTLHLTRYTLHPTRTAGVVASDIGERAIELAREAIARCLVDEEDVQLHVKPVQLHVHPGLRRPDVGALYRNIQYRSVLVFEADRLLYQAGVRTAGVDAHDVGSLISGVQRGLEMKDLRDLKK